MIGDKAISAIVLVAAILIIIAISIWLANLNPTICAIGWALALLVTVIVTFGTHK